MIFDDWSFFKRSRTQSRETKYPRQQNQNNAPNLSQLAITKYLLFSQVQQIQSLVDWFFFLTGTVHNKQKLLLSWIVYWLWCTDKLPWQKLNLFFFILAQQHYSSPLLLPTEACYSLRWLHFKDTHTRPIISYLHKILGGNYYFYIQYKLGLVRAQTTLMTVVRDGKTLRESTTEDGPLFTMTWCILKVSVCTLISTYHNYRSHLSPMQFTCQRSYNVINSLR